MNPTEFATIVRRSRNRAAGVNRRAFRQRASRGLRRANTGAAACAGADHRSADCKRTQSGGTQAGQRITQDRRVG